MYWFLGGLLVWVIGWALLEHWVAQRRLKRDKYADLNEGR